MNNILRIILKYISSFFIVRSTKLNKIHLTFDDGPHPINTRKILTILEKYNAKATFFMVGKQIEKYPDIVKLVQEHDHTIGYHSYAHNHAKDMSFISILNELRHAKSLERSLAINFNRLYRPPYGELTLSTFLAILISGWKIILWSKDSQDSYIDWEKSADIINKDNVVYGDIILLHDDYNHTSNTIELVLKNYSSNQIETAPL